MAVRAWIRTNWRSAAIVIAVASVALTVAIVAVARVATGCRIARASPYTPAEVASSMRRHGLSVSELRHVRGTRPRSIMFRGAIDGGAVVVYVRRELLQEALPANTARALRVEGTRGAGTVNVTVYVSLPAGADVAAVTRKGSQLQADLARSEVVPCHGDE